MKKNLICRPEKLSIRQQCQVLSLGRGSFYYKPRGEYSQNGLLKTPQPINGKNKTPSRPRSLRFSRTRLHFSAPSLGLTRDTHPPPISKNISTFFSSDCHFPSLTLFIFVI